MKLRFALKKFCTKVYAFRYPDEIISELKSTISAKKDTYDLESSIINNIHFFDSEQFTDIVTIFGKANKGTVDLWDLFERKVYDYELNYVQAKDMFNANIENDRFTSIFEKKLFSELNSKRITDSEKSTYDLFH